MDEHKTVAGITRSLLRYFDWMHDKMCTEYEIGGGRADLVVLTRARYLTEVEIKLTREDWKADLLKGKWRANRQVIKRFFYAVPVDLVDDAPADMDPAAGILAVHPGGLVVKQREAAVRSDARKLTDAEYVDFLEAFYFRYWRAEFLRWRNDADRRKIQSMLS